MKRSKDPFEVAYDEEEDSPPESPADNDDFDAPTPMQLQDSHLHINDPDDHPQEDDDVGATRSTSPYPYAPSAVPQSAVPPSSGGKGKAKDEDDEDDEENMDAELAAKLPSSSDPDKSLKMKAILSQFTEDQMSRYESFRRSALQKANMRRLLVSITGSQKISLPMTIVVCGIAKMFVGELIETARVVMTERRESGPIRPCHIRESYRRLKAEGKVFKKSVPTLFR